jgi:hypothetical protein
VIVNSYNIIKDSNIWERRYGSMNKVLIECGALIDKYELNRDSIMEQLQSIKVD